MSDLEKAAVCEALRERSMGRETIIGKLIGSKFFNFTYECPHFILYGNLKLSIVIGQVQ